MSGEDPEHSRDGLWVRVGGGLEDLHSGERHGPADPDSPPPGGPWQELRSQGRLVGWCRAGRAGRAVVRRAEEEGARIGRDRQAYLIRRLGHKLRSSVLALQESARQAAFGHQGLLEELYDLAQDVQRRAQALEVVALEPPDEARAVVLGAALAVAAPEAVRRVPAGAVVRASEPVLVDALARTVEWMGGAGTAVAAERVRGWWRVQVEAGRDRRPLAVPEFGEPLVRLLVDMRLDGWLDAADRESAVVYLPAAEV